MKLPGSLNNQISQKKSSANFGSLCTSPQESPCTNPGAQGST